MSEEKFTPGPWIVKPHPERKKWESKYYVYSQGKTCDCCGHTDLSGSHICVTLESATGKEQAIANANLIAAAPDMYRALKNVKEWFSKLKDWEGVGDPDVVEIMFAIDKAEGNIYYPNPNKP